MAGTISRSKEKKSNLTILMISSFLITTFLFFIDEGNYNFDWSLDLFSWIVFFIYLVPILLFQVLISNLISKRVSKTLNSFLSVVIGSFIGISFVVGIIF